MMPPRCLCEARTCFDFSCRKYFDRRAQSYVTPSWYPTKIETGRVVPTWNYATVHAWGRPRVIQDVDWIRAQVEALTGQQERMMQQPWSVSDAPEPYIAAQLRGIVGIEIEITRIEGKWKVSQNRNEADRAGVGEGLLAGGEAAREMAALVMSRVGARDVAREGPQLRRSAIEHERDRVRFEPARAHANQKPQRVRPDEVVLNIEPILAELGGLIHRAPQTFTRL